MRRYSAFLVIVCSVALVLVGCAQDATPPATDTAPASGASEAPSSDDEQAAGVTMAQFEQIKDGMTYDEVVAILGEPTQIMSDSEASGVTLKVYGWIGEQTASAVTVGFLDGEVNSTTQMGLD